MTDIQIKNSALDSNTLVNMKGVVFTPGYKRNNEAKTLNGTPTASVPEGDRISVEAPVITIRGTINVDDFESTAELWSETPSTLASTAEDGSSNANAMTLGYLLALWRNNTAQTILNIYLGDPSSQKQWKNWDNTSTDIYVVIDDINPLPDQTSDGLHFINYTIVCREVEPDGTYAA